MNTRRSIHSMTLVAISAVLAACGRPDAAENGAPRGTPVRVQAAGSGPAAPTIATSGLVATKDELTLSFKVAGLIKRITVRQGESVREGQLLAEIEPTEINSQLEQATQLAEKARRDLERGEKLYADQVISLEQLQDLRTQYAVARAGYSATRFNRDYARINAPRDGVVLRRLAEEREFIAVGAPVLILGARDRGYVVNTALSDREVVQVRLNDPAEIRLDAFPGRVLPGTISEVSAAADGRTGLFAVVIRLDSVPADLATGLVANVKIYPASSRAGKLTYVPIGALVEGDADRASVFVVDRDRVRRRPVRVAFLDAGEVAIAEGLAPGEIVVSDGALYLEDQEKIEIVAR